jgi:hypothetical protein
MWFTGTASSQTPTEIGYATSPDGITWTEYPDNPVLHSGGNLSWDDWLNDPCVFFHRESFHMWYWGWENHHELNGYANSADGINWTKHDDVVPVIKKKGSTWGEHGIRVASVIYNQADSVYNLWYAAEVVKIFGIGFAASDSLFDIAALVKYVDANKSYAAAGNDSVCITAIVKNPTGISLLAKIEAPDRVVFDSLQLYNDGNHNDGNADDSLYANIWPVRSAEERNYYVDIQVKKIDEDTVIQRINNAVLFTTIGPIVFKHNTYHPSTSDPRPGNRLLFKIILRNNGTNTTVEKVRAVITCLDSLVNVKTNSSAFKDIAPGAEISSNVWYSIDISESCPDSTEISFRVDISSDDYIFWSDSFSIRLIPTAIDEIENNIPKKFTLYQNYPNPFNPITIINYELGIRSGVDLSVYNVMGQKVATLVSKTQQAGFHQVEWDASGFTSGVYFYRLATNQGNTQIKKLVLLR